MFAIRPIRLSAALALGIALVAIQAQAGPVPVAPEAETIKFGALQLTALRDALNVLDNDGKVVGVNAGPAAVAGVLKAAGSPADKITLNVGGLLVRGDGRVMLFDTGLGPLAKGVLAASLVKAGVQPDAVTDVFITHSHGDHVGGLMTAEGQPAFPKAVIHMSAPEWTFLQGMKGQAKLVATITPQVKTFAPGAEVVQGVTSVSLPGHTPGHSGYQIRSGGYRLIDMGDVAHSSIVSLAKPEWIIQYDNDAKEGVQTRRAELARLAKSHEWVFAPHFPFPGFGRIEAKGDGFVWIPGLP